MAVLVGCHGGTSHGTLVALRPACADAEFWDGTACTPRGDAAAKVAAGKQALAKLDVDVAKVALAAADQGGPLDHDSNVTLWEQRGIAAAYLNDERTASAAFDMLLALDPSHILSYRLSTKATFVFEDVRRRRAAAPAIDVRWTQGHKVGDRIPLEIEVVADPKRFLRRATLFVRARGEPRWRAADVGLSARSTHLVLPPVQAAAPSSLELYLRAYDDRGNEVLGWANPVQPREIPLRYDPPQPWYQRRWVWIGGGSAIVVGTGILVYALTLAPPDRVSGSAGVK